MNKKKIRFTVDSIHPIPESKHKDTCQEGQCNSIATKTMIIEIGSICVLVRLCDTHADYIVNMREL